MAYPFLWIFLTLIAKIPFLMIMGKDGKTGYFHTSVLFAYQAGTTVKSAH
jgi:hypothetical protein